MAPPAGPPRPAISVRPAVAEDLPLLVGLLTRAAERMLAHGNVHGWPVPFPAAMIQGPLAAGHTHLVAQPNGPVVGTVTLLWEDPTFWGAQPPVAGYVHRLAVAPAYAGAGYGPAILDWVDAEIRGCGRTLLRLDTATTNAGLLRYYTALGFRPVGEVAHDPLRFPVTLFERAVAPRAGSR